VKLEIFPFGVLAYLIYVLYSMQSVLLKVHNNNNSGGVLLVLRLHM